MWMRLVLPCLALSLLAVSAQAKVYQCSGKSGTPVLTDRPGGLEGCVPVDTLAPTIPSGFIAPPETATVAAQPELPMPMASPAPYTGPIDHLPPPPSASQPAAQEHPESSGCSPRVNPLNPFAGVNCSPSKDTSTPSKKP
ncbi:MAG: hypothetical protein KF814_18155 [Nitrospiraceae bacterium]|nr:hypothetical protein [Nitrospiraceae bacterium]